MKNIQTLIAALMLAASASAVGPIEEGWGGQGGHGDGGHHIKQQTTTSIQPPPHTTAPPHNTTSIQPPHNTTSIISPPPHTVPIQNTTSIISPPPHTVPIQNTTSVNPPPGTGSTTTTRGLTTSFTRVTSFFTTSVPPQSTEVVISGTTFPVTKPGEVTIPIVTSKPVATFSAGETRQPPQPTAPITTAPIQVNNGVQNGASLGAFVAGLAALLL